MSANDIENVICIDRKIFDRISDLDRPDDYIYDTYNIVENDLFPLKTVKYIFHGCNTDRKNETYTINLKRDDHKYKLIIFNSGKLIGFNTITVSDFDGFYSWNFKHKMKSIVKGKEWWIKEVSLMTVTIDMFVMYSLLYSEKAFITKQGKHIIANGKRKSDDIDEVIYHKISSISKVYEKTTATKKGNCPKHEFDVRGHFRHLRSGREIYVRPYLKCKGRGTKIIHEYLINK